MSYFVFCNVSFSGFIRWVEEERANFLLSLTRIVIMWFLFGEVSCPSWCLGYAHLSQAYSILMLRRPSVRRRRRRRSQCSNIFLSETAWTIKTKFCVEPPWVEGTKVCSRPPRPYIVVCSNYYPGLTLTYFTTRSNFVT